MSDLMLAMKSILGGGWKFFTNTTIPGTDFSFAMLLVALVCVAVGFRFLSIALGFSVGNIGSPLADYGTRASRKYRISSGRMADDR